MAKVNVQVGGGSIQQKEADTLGDLRGQVDADGMQATINGEPENDDETELEDFQFITFTTKVKGGLV